MKSMIVLALYLATCLLVVSGIRSFHSNQTISGSKTACKHHTWYYVNQNVEFKICLAQSDQYLKVDGNSITDLIKARSFLPTCRVMQLMLWMYSFFSETSTSHTGAKEYFVDVGANIGSCSMHLAALGYPVIAVEPVPEHIGIITGSMQMNPSFAVNLFRGGIAHEDKQIKATLSHQEFNWGNSQIKEAESGSGSGGGTEELHLYTLDTLIAHRKVALLKLDCEGCEYSALLGAKNSLSKVAMIKFEFFENNYKAGAVTISDRELLAYLEQHNFLLFVDQWNEMRLYHGQQAKKVLDVDKLFGAERFGLTTNDDILQDAAVRILNDPLSSKTYDRDAFRNRAMDVIAIQASLVEKMKKKWNVK